MRILILTFRAGEGHNSAARAILERLEAEGHEGEIVDFLSLFSEKLSNAINLAYIRLVKYTPVLYGLGYKISRGVSRMLRRGVRSPLYLDSAIISKNLQKYMQAHGPYDGIVATHLMPAQALAHLKKHGKPLPVTVTVVTDYTWYPFWQETAACDFYVVPNEALIAKFISRGMPAEKLRPYGIPIAAQYSHLPTREEARERLGFSSEDRIYLVMGGSMGAGSLSTLTRRLADQLNGAHMVVICGNNESLRAALAKSFEGQERIHVCGFTPNVYEYMMAADVLYTKPGGLSTSEALACRIPMVFIHPIPGQEMDNQRFFVRRGCAFGAKRVSRQIRYGTMLMNSPALRDRVRVEEAKCAKPHAADDIVRLLEDCQRAEKAQD